MENFQLGVFLKNERKRLHLSSRQLAERTKKNASDKGVAASHINKIENGRTYPTFQTLQKIVTALEIPIVIILDGTKAYPDTVTIISTPEVAEFLLQTFTREELVQLLLICQKLTNEDIRNVLGIARSLAGSSQSAKKTEST